MWSGLRSCVDSVGIKGCLSLRGEARVGWGWNGGPGLRGLGHSAHTVHSIPLPLVLPTTIRALFSTVSPLSSHEVDGVRKEKERLTDGRSPRGEYEVNVDCGVVEGLVRMLW